MRRLTLSVLMQEHHRMHDKLDEIMERDRQSQEERYERLTQILIRLEQNQKLLADAAAEPIRVWRILKAAWKQLVAIIVGLSALIGVMLRLVFKI